jgi:hypothetical protein
MHRFWKQRTEFSELEQELRRERPRPRSAFVDALATELRGERVSTSPRRSLRYRLAAVGALTVLLGVAAAATGGLGYAATASSHAVSSVTHIFDSESTARTHNGAAPAKAGVQGSAGAASSASRAGGDGNGQQGDQGGDQSVQVADQSNGNGGDNAARHQYHEFVFVCLRIPRKHPRFFVTIRVPKDVADRWIARGRATPGPC